MKKKRNILKKSLLFISIMVASLLMNSCNTINENDHNKLITQQFLGKIIPRNSSEITSSPFGIQAGTMEDSLLRKAAQIGVKWTRLLAGWEGVEKEKGVYDWKETDEAIDAVLKYGITPFITLTNGNRLYTGTGRYDDPKLASIYGESPAPPVGSKEETDAWLNFVSASLYMGSSPAVEPAIIFASGWIDRIFSAVTLTR